MAGEEPNSIHGASTVLSKPVKEPPFADVAKMPESRGNRIITRFIPGALAVSFVLSMGSACGILNGGGNAPEGWRPGMPIPPKEVSPNPGVTPPAAPSAPQTPVRPRPLTYKGILAANPGMLTVATNDDNRGWNQAMLGYVKSIDQIDVVAWCRDATGAMPPRKVHATAFTSRDKDKSVATNDPKGRGWPGEFKPFSPPPESIAAFDRMLAAEAAKPGILQSTYSAEEQRLAGRGIGQAECETEGMYLSSVESVDRNTLVSEQVLAAMTTEKIANDISKNRSNHLNILLIAGGILAFIALIRSMRGGNRSGGRTAGAFVSTGKAIGWAAKKISQGASTAPEAARRTVIKGQSIGVENALPTPVDSDLTPEELTSTEEPQRLDVITEDGRHYRVPERPTHGEFGSKY